MSTQRISSTSQPQHTHNAAHARIPARSAHGSGSANVQGSDTDARVLDGGDAGTVGEARDGDVGEDEDGAGDDGAGEGDEGAVECEEVV